MTKIEALYQKQRNIGLIVSFIGFIIAIAAVAFHSISNIKVQFIDVLFGYVIGLFGFVIYLLAFISGIKYSQSKQYKRDLTPKQPWEH